MEKIPHPVISRGEYSNYTIPPLTLLDEESVKSFNESLNIIYDNGEKILRCLAVLNIKADICKTTPALRFTRYTITASETDVEKLSKYFLKIDLGFSSVMVLEPYFFLDSSISEFESPFFISL